MYHEFVKRRLFVLLIILLGYQPLFADPPAKAPAEPVSVERVPHPSEPDTLHLTLDPDRATKKDPFKNWPFGEEWQKKYRPLTEAERKLEELAQKISGAENVEEERWKRYKESWEEIRKADKKIEEAFKKWREADKGEAAQKKARENLDQMKNQGAQTGENSKKLFEEFEGAMMKTSGLRHERERLVKKEREKMEEAKRRKEREKQLHFDEDESF